MGFEYSSMEWLDTNNCVQLETNLIHRSIVHYKTIYILNNDCNVVYGRLLVVPFVKLVLITSVLFQCEVYFW